MEESGVSVAAPVLSFPCVEGPEPVAVGGIGGVM